MVIQIQFKGLRKVNETIQGLGPILNKEIMKKSEEFMSFVQKSAKLRAPRMTGRLARSIKFKKTKKNQIILTVDSPYGFYQDRGFKPHFIHSEMSDRMGGTVGGLFNQFDSFFFVSKFTPFITPAVESGISRLPSMLSNGAKKAIQKAGGK